MRIRSPKGNTTTCSASCTKIQTQSFKKHHGRPVPAIAWNCILQASKVRRGIVWMVERLHSLSQRFLYALLPEYLDSNRVEGKHSYIRHKDPQVTRLPLGCLFLFVFFRVHKFLAWWHGYYGCCMVWTRLDVRMVRFCFTQNCARKPTLAAGVF